MNLYVVSISTQTAKPAVSPISGSQTSDTEKIEKQKRSEFKTPACPAGRRSKY